MTAIAAILSVAIIMQQRLLIHQAQLSTFADQNYLLLQGVQDQAVQDIIDYENAWLSHAQNSQLLILPTHLGPKHIQDVVLNASITDEQGLFNINDLLQPQQVQGFNNLMRVLEPSFTASQVHSLVHALSSWILPGNDMNDVYARLQPPYRKAAQPMMDVTALRLVDGVTAKLYTQLEPYIMALPIANKPIPVNINSASALVLLTLPGVNSIDQAQSMVSCRKRQGFFRNTDDFVQSCAAPLGIKNLSAGITDHSQYFLIRSVAENNEQQVFLNSLIVTQRDNNNRMVARIIWQQGS